MLRTTGQWDVRLPPGVAAMFPREARQGYYFRVDREQARAILRLLAAAYGVPTPELTDRAPGDGARGWCEYLPGRASRISLHGRAHLKSVFHEFYHHLDHATGGRYRSDDRGGGPDSLAWQFGDRMFAALSASGAPRTGQERTRRGAQEVMSFIQQYVQDNPTTKKESTMKTGKTVKTQKRASPIPDSAQLVVVRRENPRRGRMAARVFAAYLRARTVGAWRATCRKARLDMGYLHADLRHGYIRVKV